MKAAIVNPYLDTLGGGERYSMTAALVLAQAGYKVDVEWKNAAIKKKFEERFGIDLTQINFVKDVGRGDGYEVCFWVSDGSVPTLQARKNFLHFQVPFHDVNGATLLNRMKFFRINKVICNSLFTKSFIDREYRVNSKVIYPPVAVEKIKPKRKEKTIVFVGRFSQLKQAKRQDVLIKAFRRLVDSGFKDWKLILAGGVEVGGREFVEELKRNTGNYPIEIIISPTFRQLKDIYGEARLFWSAVGFGAKEDKEPEKFEHFGISVVEAMAAGASPVVYRGGGHKEIIREGENGFLWGSLGELLKLTKELITAKGLMTKTARKAKEDSLNYGYERFKKEFSALL